MCFQKKSGILRFHHAKENNPTLWLNNIITNLRPLHIKTILVNCDNNGAININKNYMYIAKSMHMDIQHYFVWETVKTGHIAVKVYKL